MARRGISSCAAGLVLLAIVPQLADNNTVAGVRVLQAAAVCLAFTSATVVNSLTSYASLQCDEGVDAETGKPTAEHPQLAKGKALGHFRSSGQLGRAIGPLLGMSLPSFPGGFPLMSSCCLQRALPTGLSVPQLLMPSAQSL